MKTVPGGLRALISALSESLGSCLKFRNGLELSQIISSLFLLKGKGPGGHRDHLLTDKHVSWMVYGSYDKTACLLLKGFMYSFCRPLITLPQASRAHARMRGRKTAIRRGHQTIETEDGIHYLYPMLPSRSVPSYHRPISSSPPGFRTSGYEATLGPWQKRGRCEV
jgi:hypothetical protein